MEEALVISCILTLVSSAPHIHINEHEQNTRVIGGNTAARGEFPYLLSLQVKTGELLGTHICGAAVVSNMWAISAAHCVGHALVDKESLQIVAGEYSLQSPEGTEQRIDVAEIVVHEEFDPLTLANDIALLRLKSWLYYDRNVQPVALAFRGYSPHPLAKCVLSWLGRDPRGRPDVGRPEVREAPRRLGLVLRRILRRIWLERLGSSTLCAGYEGGGADACSQDDGGPLVCEAGAHKYLVGIASFGIGCGRPRQPGVYTEVSYFAQWAAEVTGGRR
ncbi:trypsin-1-like isoform X2 [Macrobrachium nipponense]|uniref:trypsin-1-like isoform X2 n=1 Tax=Macrobrachium nipponense TaxID=159736 RepID=UPI0030C7B67D